MGPAHWLPPRWSDIDAVVRKARLRYGQQSRREVAKVADSFWRTAKPPAKKSGRAVQAGRRRAVASGQARASRVLEQAKLYSLIAYWYLEVALRRVGRLVVCAARTGASEVRAVLATISRKAALELPSILAAGREAGRCGKSWGVRGLEKGAKISSLAIHGYLEPTSRAVGRIVISGLLAGAAKTALALAMVPRKAGLAFASSRNGCRRARVVAFSATEGIKSSISEDPFLLLKTVVVVVGFALSVACGIVLPGMLGIVPPAK